MLRFLAKFQKYEIIPLWINDRQFIARVSDSYIKRAIGLMFREQLHRGECMLFIYPSSDRHSIWMRNMRFPIDVLWLDENKHVVDYVLGLQPSDTNEYFPSSNAQYVLELPTGTLGAVPTEVVF